MSGIETGRRAPRRANNAGRRSLAGAIAVMVGAGAFVVSGAASAAAGPVEARAVGLSGSVQLLGLASVNIPAQPVAAFPTGPAADEVLGVNVNGVASTGVVRSTTDGDPLADTSSASASVDGLNLVSALVTADAIGSTCTGTPAGVTGAATLANATVGLPLLNRITIPANPAPNTSISVKTVLNVEVATLILNEQVAQTVNGVRTLDVTALRLKLLSVPLVGLGVGDVRIGVSHCGTTAPTAPTLSGLAPAAGPTTGGTHVVLTGGNFLGLSGVAFDGVPAAFTRDSLNQVTAITPAHVAGPVTVSVTNSAGTATAPVPFEYRLAPRVTSIAPDSGATGGGASVVITGTGFTQVTGVTFGDDDATSYTVDSATQITAVAPAGSGSVPVRVTTAGGTTPDVAGSWFSYLAVPTLSAVTPAQGTTTGGTPLTLNGTGFTPDAQVLIDGVAMPTTVLSPTLIKVVTPAHAAGTVPVVVTTPGGSSSAQPYRFFREPVVTGLSPAAGPEAGGTTLTVTGTGLSDVVGVFAEGAATPPGNQSDTSLSIVTPAHNPGPIDVFLVNPDQTLTPAGTFTYEAAPQAPGLPAVSAIAPATGVVGTRVTVTGTDLTGATSVDFDGVNGTNLSVVSDTEVRVDAPAGSGAVTVSVNTPSGASVPNAGSTFTYRPVLTSLDPGNGLLTGGTVVTVNGSSFTPSAVVTIDGTPVTTTYVSPTELTFTTPPHLPGNAAVVVKVGAASSSAVSFSYLALPTVSAMSPDSGPTTGGTTVSVTGLLLNLVQSVSVDGEPATDVVQGLTTLTFKTPAHSAGPANVQLDLLLGLTVNAGTFTFVSDAPDVIGISPAAGPLAGGNLVTLSGSGLTGASVTVGGTAVSVDVTSGGGTLTFTAPSGLTAGPVPVVVTTAGGVATIVYTYLAPPDATTLTPSTGSAAGGTVVTVSGSNLAGVTSVKFDGVAGTQLTVVSNSQVTVRSPAHAVGAVAVTVSGPGGSDQLPYTYAAVPVITSVSPASGPTDGGNVVTITGHNFTGVTAGRFGNAAVTQGVVHNDTTIQVLAPPNTAGVVTVYVTGPGGESIGSSQTRYGYTTSSTTPTPTPAAPTVTGMTPDHGPAAGGTVVTLTGTGFTGATGGKFGDTPVTQAIVDSDTQIRLKTPAHAEGAVAVTVTGPGGTSAGRTYTYDPDVTKPVVTGLSVARGLTVGGAEILVTGTGFTGATALNFGDVPATGGYLKSDTEILAVTPQQPAGTVAVTVRGPGGTSAVTGATSFRYLGAAEAPDATGLTPRAGATAGGVRVTLRAANLDSSTRITFGGVAGTDLRLGDDPTSGTSYDVANYPYTSFDGNADGYVDAYDGTLDGRGAAVSGTPGTNSRPGADASDADYQVGTATVVVPALPAGAVDVTVTTAAGSDTLAGGYTAVAPIVTSSQSISGTTEVGRTTAVTPFGSVDGSLTVQECGTPKHGTIKISADTMTCVYTAPASPVDDVFTMKVVNALGEVQDQTVNVKVTKASVSGTDDGGLNLSDGGTTTGTTGGTTSGTTTNGAATNGTLAFTGLPTSVLVAIGTGMLLVLGGFLLLATGGSGPRPVTVTRRPVRAIQAPRAR